MERSFSLVTDGVAVDSVDTTCCYALHSKEKS